MTETPSSSFTETIWW